MPIALSTENVFRMTGLLLTPLLAPQSRRGDKTLGVRLGKHFRSWKWVFKPKIVGIPFFFSPPNGVAI